MEDLDFSQLTFNIMDCLPPKLVVDSFDRIAKHKVFVETGYDKKFNDKVLRYIILFYDPNTPLKNKIDDIKQRKVLAAKLAGFVLKGNHFEDRVTAIINNNDTVVNRMIIAFSRLFNSRSYSSYIIKQDIYYRELEKSLNLDYDKLMSAQETRKLDELEAMVDKAELKFLNEDKSVQLSRDLFGYIEETNFEEMPLPEHIAAKTRDGKEGITLEEIR